MANMTKTNTTNTKPKFSIVLQSDTYQKLINNTLRDKQTAQRFIADVSTLVGLNPMLQDCEPSSIVSGALAVYTMGLSLSPSLGQSYLVPYQTKYGNKAQLQVGYKGFIQMAQRSGQFLRLGVRVVHEGEYQGQDEFGDDMFKFSHDCDNNPVVGYFAYFRLLNGFRKTMYWTVDQCKQHAKKYSKAYGTGKSTDNWTYNFDQMACKTVLKLLLNRYAPLSAELQQAIKYDQAVANNNGDVEYVDNAKYVEEETTPITPINNLIDTDTEEEDIGVVEHNTDIDTDIL